MLKDYLSLTKPGIILGNLVPVAGGFLLASGSIINFSLFLATLLGVTLIIASGCTFNNYIDRDIDKLMVRTKNRALAQGTISPSIALFYASLLGVAGLIILYTFTNLLATLLALFGFIIYVVVYSLYLKRHSIYSVLVGSLSGATPPVIGYCVVSNNFDFCAVLLLVTFSIWQMPHSYAIAIFRYNDYLASAIPVLPIKIGIQNTKLHIVIGVTAFMITALLLFLNGYTGTYYFFTIFITTTIWIMMAICGYKTKNDRLWARNIFIFSIIAITILSIMMAIDSQVLLYKFYYL